MGFFSNIISAAVKTATLPVAAVVDVATLGKSNVTKELVEDIGEDLGDAFR
jgi:hypothetical protein